MTMVYGDRAEQMSPREQLERIRAASGAIVRPSENSGSDQLTGLLIDAGMLVQGLADLRFEASQIDDDFPMTLPMALARQAWSAWRGAEPPPPAEVHEAVAELQQMELPSGLSCRIPEGYAFYAVYPEAYMVAAQAAARPSPPLVIGLRSIGVSLAAAAAAGAGSNKSVTLRPVGHPFDRHVEVTRALRGRLESLAGDVLIVDEGPGLSGSSFMAAADLLHSVGVADARITLMPSHAGEPGRVAGPERLMRWRSLPRRPVGMEDLRSRGPLEGWFEDVTGAVDEVEELSGGAWRAELPEPWPPAWRQHERLKFRLTSRRGVFLARFAGLGRIGEAKFARARALHAAGFVPKPLALRRGFLLERWRPGRQPSFEGERRARFLVHLGDYLAFRNRAFPARPEEGADLPTLRQMSLVNGEALGGEYLRRGIERAWDHARIDGRELRLAHVDGRLQPWEWREDGDGRLWKTDAVDHSCAHDLIGCQDIAWDVAGAAAEYDLAENELGELFARSGAASRMDRSGLKLFEIAYCAFQAAAWDMAAADPEETARARRRQAIYLDRLRALASSGEEIMTRELSAPSRSC